MWHNTRPPSLRRGIYLLICYLPSEFHFLLSSLSSSFKGSNIKGMGSQWDPRGIWRNWYKKKKITHPHYELLCNATRLTIRYHPAPSIFILLDLCTNNLSTSVYFVRTKKVGFLWDNQVRCKTRFEIQLFFLGKL